jgi:hypothetical protein
MTTILRKYHSVARCTLLGEMIEDTAHRYYYRPHVGGELTFVDKSPAIHLTPCPACPDWQQRGSAGAGLSRSMNPHRKQSDKQPSACLVTRGVQIGAASVFAA